MPYSICCVFLSIPFFFVLIVFFLFPYNFLLFWGFGVYCVMDLMVSVTVFERNCFILLLYIHSRVETLRVTMPKAKK